MHERRRDNARQVNECHHMFEDVVAEEDVLHFVGSANGHTTTARRITVKRNTVQFLGDASDTTIQKIFCDGANLLTREGHAPNE